MIHTYDDICYYNEFYLHHYTGMNFLLYMLMLVASLLHITASTVYHVMPDNHYHPINDNTYTLQHYLNNTNKYFTSNTQLHFLPGQYYLNNDLIIQGVSNFSLIGNRTNEVINTVINCTSPAGIVVVNSSNIVIANIVMKECGNDYKSLLMNMLPNQHGYNKTLFVLNSKIVTITYVYSIWYQKICGLVLVNALESKLSNLVSTYLSIWYTANANLIVDTTDTLFIESLQIYNVLYYDVYAMNIEWHGTTFNFQVTVLNVNFTNDLALSIACKDCLGHSMIIITNCSFSDTEAVVYDFDYSGEDYDYDDSVNFDLQKRYYEYSGMDKIRIHYQFTNPERDRTAASKLSLLNCHFMNNYRRYKVLDIEVNNSYNREDDTNVQSLAIHMYNCSFYYNKHVQFLSVECYNDGDNDGDNRMYCVSVLIENTTISSNIQYYDNLIYVSHVTLTFEQVKIINNIIAGYQYDFGGRNISIIKAQFSNITYNKFNEITNNSVNYVIEVLAIHINENSVLNISFNMITSHCVITYNNHGYHFETCAIQYISERGNLDKEFQMGQRLNYTIIINSNNMSKISNNNLKHCRWDASSAFLTSSPLLVNQKLIGHNISTRENYKKRICLCRKNHPVNCYSEEIGPFYPGETVSCNLALVSSSTSTVLLDKDHNSYFSCQGTKSTVVVHTRECKNMQFTVTHENGIWCELCLKAVPLYSYYVYEWMDIYTITLSPCPKGFLLHSEGYCWCDPILSSYIPSLTHCDIDDQTIPRPANSWISAHTVNNSHSYHVSLHCPFDYCLPHSSHLNLSTPYSQCQFHRSGLLCGQCQQGLSAVFGSSQCKHCSNVYLLIIIPIAIAGLILVLLLFLLNLTVTDGDINAFIFYVNIISINNSIIFPINNTVIHAFVSLANLDLGITICFYNGMDNYAKVWLQLLFPAYLIFIATLIIIVSRYYSRIQRLTARRALPVLATLFLLSYTKVLLTVSSILFYYSTITHLPSNETKLVWLVDPNLPLFEVKFTLLFMVCFILFFILVLFSVALIFTKKSSQFKIINYFKPMLNAYQGPYKLKFYYWTGLQLLIRAVSFGLTTLDKHLTLMLSVILLGAFIWLAEKLSPFKRKGSAIIDKLFLLNLFLIFAMNISNYNSVTNIMIMILLLLAILQLSCIVILHTKESLHETFPKCKKLLDFSKASLQTSKRFTVLRNFTAKRCARHDLELAS